MDIELRLSTSRTPIPNTAEWRVAARGSGVFHTWIWSGGPLDEPRDRNPLDDPQYRPRDNSFTLSSPSTLPEVIGVGAIANLGSGVSCQIPIEACSRILKIGDLFPFSSRGPSSGWPAQARPCGSGGADLRPWSGDSTNYRTAAGTSVSAPVVAGAVALYFERFPQVTNREVWLRPDLESAASGEFHRGDPQPRLGIRQARRRRLSAGTAHGGRGR